MAREARAAPAHHAGATRDRLSRNISAADSVDELLQVQAELEAEANARIQPWQQAIQKGDDVRDRFKSAERGVYTEVLRVQPRRPYSLVCAYARAVPDGELGDIQRSIVKQVISRETFEHAPACAWHVGCIVQPPLLHCASGKE